MKSNAQFAVQIELNHWGLPLAVDIMIDPTFSMYEIRILCFWFGILKQRAEARPTV